ncbi:YfiM family protein [Polaribacter sp. Z014]|uniref:DUF2279 domain-containing protein n=1 Tax=Polaribacter sp. Z014 TaxID=2927126 RepID=UPI002021E698|nr:DUF2279 domain-containing protein [Polaribacter sp. Z014]MCL7762846.1 YfiM family protein [Polaribacter sp. Z014]
MIQLKVNKLIVFSLFFLLTVFSHAQNAAFYKKSDTLNTKRRNAIIVAESVLAGGALISLNQLWYKDYPRSSFHLKNDNNDWKQMDKVGHLMTSYYVGKIGMEALDWAGVSKKNQLIYGATSGFAFLTAVEVLDGFSEEWGASPGDILANASGTGLLIGQELLWGEQRITVKYSFHQTEFAKQRPNTLGINYLQQALKDYNGQTYWLSANIWSFNKKSSFPKWLNVALGYGAEEMLYGHTNAADATPYNPYRQFYLSLDLDLTKIRTNSEFLKSVFSVVNFIKIPAPTLEINTKGRIKFHYLYF